MSDLKRRLGEHYAHVTTYGSAGDVSADLVKEAEQHIAELEAEVAAMERERESLNASWHSRCLRTEVRAKAAEAKLEGIEKAIETDLNHEWATDSGEPPLAVRQVLDGLAILLKGEKP